MERQKKILSKPVIIEEKKESEVKKILNKRVVRGKKKFLVRWKECKRTPYIQLQSPY